MKRIGLAGLHHETNTFSPELATFDIFLEPDNWPGLTRGLDYFTTFKQGNIPTVGFLQNITDVELLPLTWANAEPSGKVTQAAYETIVDYILIDLKKALPLDALYLDLHGAMVCQHLDDGEGELLKRIRKIVGNELPIIITHDLHANVSDTTFALSDCIISYRTYPHVDMAETGKRAAKQLKKQLINNKKPFKAIRRLPFLIPMTTQCSLISPNKDIYAYLECLEQETRTLFSFNPGFPLADTDYTSPTILAYGESADQVEQELTQLYHFIMQQKSKFCLKLYSEQQAIDYFKQQHQTKHTFIFADTQDNPGCGGLSNTMGIFHSLIENNITNTAVAIICDPNAAEIAHDHAIGDLIELEIGNKFKGQFSIKNLSNGKFIGTGDFYKDLSINLGKMALLEHNGIYLIISTRKMQAADQAIFYHMGLKPTDFDLLVLKSSVHFRADFENIAENIIVVKSPGENIADLTELDYQHCKLPPL